MTTIEKMRLVNELAMEAMDKGEIPVAAMVFRGDEVLSKAYTTEKADGRFLVHAEQKALSGMDKLKLSIAERKELELVTNLEPCMMCLGTAISSFIGKIVYSLDAGSDGAVRWASETWDKYHKDSFFQVPPTESGILKNETIDIFKEFIKREKTGPYVEWVKELICQE